MAAGRKRSDQIRAFDLAGRCRHRDARRNRQNAPADRARPSGTQARNSASITMKDEAGEAFTPLWRPASRPTDSCLRTESDSPLRRQTQQKRGVNGSLSSGAQFGGVFFRPPCRWTIPQLEIDNATVHRLCTILTVGIRQPRAASTVALAARPRGGPLVACATLPNGSISV